MGRITGATTAACWRNFLAMARELNSSSLQSSPPKKALATSQTNTIDWDPRLGEDHG